MSIPTNLQELIDAVGDAAKAQAQLYGPTILKMGADDIKKWIDYVFVGRYLDAYTLYLKAAGDDALLSEWDAEHAAWTNDNAANKAKIAMSNQIAQAFAQAMLAVILAAVGL